MAYETILVETRGRVGLLTINRPKALNALNTTVLREVIEALGQMDWELIAMKEDEESKAELRARMDAWQQMSPDFVLKD